MSRRQHDDLATDELLALDYARGALAPVEAEEFEARLVEEPALCDALEHMVWTMEAAVAEPGVPSAVADADVPSVAANAAPSSFRGHRVVALAAAGVLLFLGLSWMLSTPTDELVENPAAQPTVEEDLLDLWLALDDAEGEAGDLRSESGLRTATDEGMESDSETAFHAELESELDAEFDQQELPPWIWTALESSG